MLLGTGSVALSFVKNAFGRPIFHQRAGGYGSLLGDEGSGYHVGKMMIGEVLDAFDRDLPSTLLHTAIYEHFDCQNDHQLLLERIYEEHSKKYPNLDSTARIASISKLVFEHAFDEIRPDLVALKVVEAAAKALVKLIQKLMFGPVLAREATLVLGGSLFKARAFKRMLQQKLEEGEQVFGIVRVVSELADVAAVILAEHVL